MTVHLEEQDMQQFSKKMSCTAMRVFTVVRSMKLKDRMSCVEL